MNATRAIGNVAGAARPLVTQPSVEQLEDALYDILATGVDPSTAPGALAAVQALLHEHARQRKSHAELIAFFDAYGLSFNDDRLARATSALELPSIDSSGIANLPPSAADVRRLEEPFLALLAQRTPAAVWALCVCGLLVLGAAIGVGYTTITGLRAELQSVRQQTQSSAQVLQQVQSEAERLRGGLQENAVLVQRANKKSDLLMRSLLSPIDPAKAE